MEEEGKKKDEAFSQENASFLCWLSCVVGLLLSVFHSLGCSGDQTFGVRTDRFPVESQMIANIREREGGIALVAYPISVRFPLFFLFIRTTGAVRVKRREHL